MDTPEKPNATDSLSIGVSFVDDKREAANQLIEALNSLPTETITEEHFLTAFSKLQVVMAEFFAREEEVIRLIGLPESEIRKHFMEHDKLLDYFNTVYEDSMAHKTTMAGEIFRSLRTEVERHFKEYDLKLRDALSARHGLSSNEVCQLTGIPPNTIIN